MTVETDIGAARLALESALDRCDGVLAEIARLEAKDFTFTLPKTVLGTLKTIATQIRRDLESLERNPAVWAPETPANERFDAVRTQAEVLTWVYEDLDLLQGVDSARLPHEMVRAFESVATDLVRRAVPAKQAQETPAVRLLLKPSNTYNYGVLDLFVALSYSSYRPHSIRNAFLLEFPAAEPELVPMHTLLLHEIGHPLFEILKPSLIEQFTQALVAAESALEPEIASEIEKDMAARGFPKPKKGDLLDWEHAASLRRLRILDEAQSVAVQWAGEIFSDLCALRIGGPAYICGFHLFSVPLLEAAEASATHPDLALRNRLLELFKKQLRGKNPAFDALCQKFDPHATIPALTDHIGVEALPFKIARHMLRSDARNPFISFLGQAAEKCIPSPPCSSWFAEAIERALDGLQELIPPDPYLHLTGPRQGTEPAADAVDDSEVDSAAVVSFVLCVLWLFRLSRLNDWAKRFGWTKAEAKIRLDQVGLKSLETGELRRCYLTNGTRPGTKGGRGGHSKR